MGSLEDGTTVRSPRKGRVTRGPVARLTTIAVLVAVGGALAVARHAGASLTGDTTPPQLVSLTITPSAIDTSTAPQSVTVKAHITDDLAGLSDGGAQPVSA